MSKCWLSIMTAAALSLGVLGFIPPGSETAELNSDIELSVEQKTEMSELQTEMLELKSEIVDKYVEFGVFTEEKGEKIISHYKERYEDLENNEFIPKWDKKHHKHCDRES